MTAFTLSINPDVLMINLIRLRGPEMQALYAHLIGRDSVREDLLQRFAGTLDEEGGSPTDVINDALLALTATGLVREWRDGETTHYVAIPGSAQVNFCYRLLAALCQASKTRLGAFIDLYAACVEDGTTLVTREELLDIARERVSIDATWTSDKINLFRSIGEYCGIVTRVGQMILIAPRPDDLHAWLQALAPDGERWARDTFDELHATFAPCFDRAGHLHPGWHASLEVLEREGRVELLSGSDAHASLTTSQGSRWSRIAIKRRQVESVEDELSV